jgi:multiple sugar transport system substrate-binding protein
VNWKRTIVGGVAVVLVGLLVGWLTRHPDDVVDPAWLKDPANGPVRYCSGEDVSRTQLRSVHDFQRSRASGSATATLNDDFSADADTQHERYLDAVRSGSCDVVYLDVAYVPEFAAEGLLYDMTPYLHDENRQARFDDKMLQTVAYGGRQWGVPKQLDGGVLFYRNDSAERPETWEDVFEHAVPGDDREKPGLRLTLDGYEGLTVTLLELVYAAGGDPIVSQDGVAHIKQAKMLEVLEKLRDAIDDRALPPEAVTKQKERGTLGVFRFGNAKFMRNWVYADALVRKTTTRATVRSLPPWTAGRSSIGVLGGHDLVIPRSAKNPAAALHLIRFLTTPEQLERDAREGDLAPPVQRWEDNPAVTQSRALSELAKTDLIPRPIIPQYYEISRVISTEVSKRLKFGNDPPPSRKTLNELLATIQAKVTEKLAGS